MGWISAGKFHAWDGVIDITDPCYDQDVWARLNGVRVRRGTYNANYFLGDNGRIEKIAIAHISINSTMNLETLYKDVDYIGDIAVDAGLAGFFISPKPDYDQKEWQKICDGLATDRPAVSLNSQGFFTSSGWGDGLYGVFGKIVDGEFVSLFIDFIVAEDDFYGKKE
jgi:hypothetical protein